MIREHLQYRTTIATILADDRVHIEAGWDAMIKARQEIERHIAIDSFFAVTYEPYSPQTSSNSILRMAEAAEKAGVGPMAAVAGTIAWCGVEAMAKEGAAFGLIDNGGDIAVISDRVIRIGLHAGMSAFSDRIAFMLPPQDTILGVCTSSATVGPSVSLGTADAVTVFSHNVSLADAWATSLCNTTDGVSNETIKAACEANDIEGVVVTKGDRILSCGAIPKIVPASVSHDLITEGR